MSSSSHSKNRSYVIDNNQNCLVCNNKSQSSLHDVHNTTKTKSPVISNTNINDTCSEQKNNYIRIASHYPQIIPSLPNPIIKIIELIRHKIHFPKLMLYIVANWFVDRFHFLVQIRKYKLNNLKTDFVAGLTVGVLLIPQSMAYAFLAGLPPIYGLYSSSFIIVVYAFFASSTQLCVGPVAPTAILITSAIEGLNAVPFSDEYIELAIDFCLITGIVQLVLGIFRFGFIVKFMSLPVMNGFTTGAAFIIIANQLRDLFGLKFSREKTFYKTIIAFFSNIHGLHVQTLLISIICILLLMAFRLKPLKTYIPKQVPIQMILLVCSIFISQLSRFDKYGIDIVGQVPSGVPGIRLPNISRIWDMVPYAFIVSIAAFMGSIALAQKFATKRREKLDPNQELIAFGIACIYGSFNYCHTISGSFSRTALNYEMGAVSQISTLIQSFLIIFSLILLTSVFKYLPKAVLASMIAVSVIKLINFEEILYLWKVKREDLLQYFTCLVVILFWGIEIGLIAAVCISLLMQIQRMSMFPAIRYLGVLLEKHKQNSKAILLKHNKTFDSKIGLDSSMLQVDKARFHTASFYRSDSIVVLKFRSEIFFANSKFLIDEIDNLISLNNNNNNRTFKNLRYIILDFSSVAYIDSTGQRDLFQIFEHIKIAGQNQLLHCTEHLNNIENQTNICQRCVNLRTVRNINLLIAGAPGNVRDTLNRAQKYSYSKTLRTSEENEINASSKNALHFNNPSTSAPSFFNSHIVQDGICFYMTVFDAIKAAEKDLDLFLAFKSVSRHNNHYKNKSLNKSELITMNSHLNTKNPINHSRDDNNLFSNNDTNIIIHKNLNDSETKDVTFENNEYVPNNKNSEYDIDDIEVKRQYHRNSIESLVDNNGQTDDYIEFDI